ncbi:hypothetical protein EVAR_80001_1 [Eumeta japonica]|uniref:Uncharacterized protein n=1 Tax=Eumeta variegata TaxID=151549 RepID=A0A4C1WP77_EUMVA|nr:hypothetical protein EVAR_80001_1 [Eumeta japonica]
MPKIVCYAALLQGRSRSAVQSRPGDRAQAEEDHSKVSTPQNCNAHETMQFDAPVGYTLNLYLYLSAPRLSDHFILNIKPYTLTLWGGRLLRTFVTDSVTGGLEVSVHPEAQIFYLSHSSSDLKLVLMSISVGSASEPSFALDYEIGSTHLSHITASRGQLVNGAAVRRRAMATLRPRPRTPHPHPRSRFGRSARIISFVFISKTLIYRNEKIHSSALKMAAVNEC